MRPAYPPQFRYIKATSLAEALEAVREGATPLAGGQSLSTLLKLRLLSVEALVDIFELDELRYVERRGDRLALGALLVHNDVAMHREVVSWAPALSEAAWRIADIQVRNRGTLGGSLAHADPAANYLPPLMALDAEVVLRGRGGERVVRAEEFVKGPYYTVIDRELVAEVRVPRWERQATVVFKIGGASYPSLVVAAAVKVSEGVVTKSRVAVGGYYTRPVAVDKALDGAGLKGLDSHAEKILDLLPQDEPYEDPHLSFEKKRRLLPQLLAQALRRVADGAEWRLPTRDAITKWRGNGGGQLLLNGRPVEVDVEPRVLLIDFLRRAGATEVKRGCDEGRCGACTVLIDGKAVKSCTIFAVQAKGHEVTTVKGLSQDGLNPVQKAFLEEYASQCGYCTHGFILAVYHYLKDVDPEADPGVLKMSIRNICRCTGYVNILRAIKKASSYLRR
ncbi:FAD binding domain-containing protein [Pyrobaculum ferrireducens]|uniref:Molybdopterin binding oxidoreductase small and medium subunit n=1 Tax=Pyrobaculum ferrireducens TaxID=1104324 RepID=G7VCF7_9CREN|nr:FAD binding domain-containing protein [Pyrobaculum ferrireducens]AET32577.1 molybdopterin binding oxidoreductase small and medium subunit [Pyrobaculum ferrireducens]